LAEDPSEGWTWDRLAGEPGSDSITSGERAELYHAYLRHVLLPEVRVCRRVEYRSGDGSFVVTLEAF
jgi:hypothetical protein